MPKTGVFGFRNFLPRPTREEVKPGSSGGRSWAGQEPAKDGQKSTLNSVAIAAWRQRPPWTTFNPSVGSAGATSPPSVWAVGGSGEPGSPESLSFANGYKLARTRATPRWPTLRHCSLPAVSKKMNVGVSSIPYRSASLCPSALWMSTRRTTNLPRNSCSTRSTTGFIATHPRQ